jgi:hypothetical protein
MANAQGNMIAVLSSLISFSVLETLTEPSFNRTIIGRQLQFDSSRHGLLRFPELDCGATPASGPAFHSTFMDPLPRRVAPLVLRTVKCTHCPTTLATLTSVLIYPIISCIFVNPSGDNISKFHCPCKKLDGKASTPGSWT